jgi:hypothetical protein
MLSQKNEKKKKQLHNKGLAAFLPEVTQRLQSEKEVSSGNKCHI